MVIRESVMFHYNTTGNAISPISSVDCEVCSENVNKMSNSTTDHVVFNKQAKWKVRVHSLG